MRVAQASAWLASMGCAIVPIPAEPTWPGSRLALAALPFVALAGLPEARGVEVEARSTRTTLATCALWIAAALGPLALAARVDAMLGRATFGLGLVGLASIACVAVLAAAAHRARGSRRHALAWGMLVVAGPALAACTFAADPNARAELAGSALAWAARASPIALAWSWARDLEHATLGVELLVPVATLAIVTLAARGGERAS